MSILARHSNRDEPVRIDELGEPFVDWYGGGPKDFLSKGLLLFMHENQGVCNWAIKLDGSSDPPVVVEVDTAPDAKWQPYADHFSTFVWCQIWDHPNDCIGVAAQEVELTEVDLSFLKSNFHQLPTTFGWPGKVNYRFKSGNARILLWDGKDRGVDWFLAAPTAVELKELLQKVWNRGRSTDSLYGDGEAEMILRQMRSEARR